MSDDYAGIADDSRDGQYGSTEQNASGVAAQNAECNSKPDDRRRINEPSSKETHDIDEIVLQAPEEVKEYLAEAMLVQGWSGLLPDPDSFNRYDKSVQDKMVAWNDAKILDESKRLDKIVEATIEQSRKQMKYTLLLNVFFASLSFVAFVMTGSALSFSFLAVPGISIVVNFFKEKSEKNE